MKIVVSMPVSWALMTPEDSLASVNKLQKALTAKVKVYSQRGGYMNQHIPLFHNTQIGGVPCYVFRTGLLTRLESIAPTLGLRIESKTEDREIPVQDPSLLGKTINLRPYQQKAVDRMMKFDMGILCSATGSGKTYMGAAMIAYRAVPTLYLVHTVDLMQQTVEKFREILGVDIGMVGDGVFDVKPVTVAMVQTLASMMDGGCDCADCDHHKGYLEKALGIKFGMIITDECHHIPCDTFFEATAAFSCRYVYGLSATPDRTDKADMMIEAGAGPITAEVGASELITQKRLAKAYCRHIPIAAKTSYYSAPPYMIYETYIVKYEVRNRKICEIAKEEVGNGMSVLIAVRHIKHAEIIRTMLDGFPCVVLDGRDSSATRRETLGKFRTKEVPLLISTLMKEGVDIPSLNVVINAGGGSGSRQLVGRALRLEEGKDHAVIYDFIDNQHVSLQKLSFARMQRLKKEPEFMVIAA